MRRRDPTIVPLVLLGFAAGYAGRWLGSVLPGYDAWPWWRQLALRAAVLGASALLAWAVIAWRLDGEPRPEAGPYWFIWTMGVAVGAVIDEVHAAVERLLP